MAISYSWDYLKTAEIHFKLKMNYLMKTSPGYRNLDSVKETREFTVKKGKEGIFYVSI